jgi:hypothetical protein
VEGVNISFDDIDEQVSNENKDQIKKMWKSYQWDGVMDTSAVKLCNEYVRGALKARLARNSDTYVTLSG